MLRYLKLYSHFIRFSLSKAFEFRVDFALNSLLAVVYALGILGFYKIIFLHSDTIAGWGQSELLLLVGAWLMVDALQNTMIAANMEELPLLVNRGGLDYYLLRPVSSLFFVSLRDIMPQSWVDFLIATLVLGLGLQSYPEELAGWKILLFFLLIINGTFLYYLLRLLLIIPVFWIHSSEGLSILFWSLHRFGERPDRIFTGMSRKILVSILPFCLIVSFPTRLLVEPFDLHILLHLALVTLGLASFTFLLWNRALRSYSSASS